MSKILINLITFYQRYLSFDTGFLRLLTPGGACKYPISCSEYTKRAIRDFGTVRGIVLGTKRVWSCR